MSLNKANQKKIGRLGSALPARAGLVSFLIPLSLMLLLASWIPLPATPGIAALQADLDAGGERRLRAIWYVYQNKQHALLPHIACYLTPRLKKCALDPDDISIADQRAVLHTMQSYKDDLERYLPDWYNAVDQWIKVGRDEKSLLMAIELAHFFREDRMVHALLRLQTDPRSIVRLQSFAAIDAMQNDRLIPAILKLSNEDRAIYRLYAAEAMAHFPDKRLLDTIRRLIGDSSKSVRIYALLALARQQNAGSQNHQAAQQFTQENNPEVRRRVMEIIRMERWGNLIHLVHRGIGDSNASVRLAALQSAQAMNNRAAALFVSRQLEVENDPELKLTQINTLLFLQNGGRGLIRVLQGDADASLRARAAFALGVLKEHQGIGQLISSMHSDQNEAVRLEAAWALSYFQNSAVNRGLAAMLGAAEPNYNLQITAALALGQIQSRESLDLLHAAVQDNRGTHFALQLQNILNKSRK
ncbi:MAG: HEAT repeat domain-containing protein [Leptospiraceae bacterium]|nr:HEAT repeat domain-containing protein [Leptospiraceae bacterium]